MKKISVLLIMLLLILTSCSDSGENVDTSPKLVIKLEQTQLGSTDTDESNYQYDSNNRMIKIVDRNNKVVIDNVLYDADGNLTKLNQPGGTSDNYEYTNGKLSKHIRIENNITVTTVEYFYKNNIIISEKTTDNFNSNSNSRVFNYEYNGNTVKKVDASNANNYRVIKHDGKKNPFSGINYLIKALPFSSLGNVIEVKTYSNGNLSFTTTNTITYDNENYPTKIVTKEINGSGNTWGETRIYTYNK
ncbi:hypothetical protein [Tenacibaculum aiptasiae]|uniref:hypothetical protein n=1 Tax=Tenacibaculum aiptasiae TaxID=426481 RepID=UPI00232FC28B|nr:hypothetical protein [Tenacibaculum aiptasiae]